MKEVPDALGLRRENLPASAVESVNNKQIIYLGLFAVFYLGVERV